MNHKILIIGAGPAGLTAAWEAEKLGIKTLVLEGDKEVGGISRTVERNGWRFDIGGHRFFTKVDEVYKGNLGVGYYDFVWGRDIQTSGNYFIHYTNSNGQFVTKVNLIK